MSPREVVEKWILQPYTFTLSASAMAELLFARLKTEGLFIGPLVSTPEMEAAYVEDASHSGSGRAETWDGMVQEWLRTEGQ